MNATEIKYWYLRNHDLFNHLNEAEVNDLCIISSFKKGKKSEIIYFSDQQIDRLYILKQGRIKIAYYDEKEEEIVSEILKEGDIFGELSLKQSDNNNQEFAQVISDEVSICSFTLENFQNVLRKKPDLAIAYTQKVGDKLKTMGAKYSDLIFKDVKTRIINFFKYSAKNEGKWEGEKVELNMYLTHQDIANFTAASRQTVSTIINELIKDGKIVYDGRKKVVIPNITKL
jgi:CRP/FNR family transcriptional regulator, cyclic AMP receptor protein